MVTLRFERGEVSPKAQHAISEGLERHALAESAPGYQKQRVSWLALEGDDALVGALTADILWDWIYIDELWVDEALRGEGLGRELMEAAEDHARDQSLVGLWLWTQSWQAAGFYQRMGFVEFTRFPNFPKGHERVGLRKQLSRP